jgi:cell wall assembly regulator SMI1
MESTRQLVERLLARWAADGTESLPATEAAVLDRLERRHDVRLPPDLRTYFERTGGLADLDWDSELIGWWGATRVVPLSTFCPTLAEARGFFVVADVLMECTHYSVQLHTTARWPYGTVIEGDGARHRVRASSWSEFIRLRLDEPARILVWREGQPDDGPNV